MQNIKNIFQKHSIGKITFENGHLFIEYDNKINSIKQVKVNNQEFKELEKYCQEHNKKGVDRQELGIGSREKNTSANPNQNKNNHHLAIGLALGAGAVILVGAIAYFIRKRKKE